MSDYLHIIDMLITTGNRGLLKAKKYNKRKRCRTTVFGK